LVRTFDAIARWRLAADGEREQCEQCDGVAWSRCGAIER
jgi:hypothetical protein